MIASMEPHGSFWKKFTPLFGAGVVGVAALVPAITPLARTAVEKMPNPSRLPLPALTALSLIQPTVLMGGAVAIGILLAPKLGLRSHIIEQSVAGTPILPALRAEAPLAATLGTGAALTTVAFDLLFRPWIGEQVKAMAETMPHNTIGMTVAGVLGGGIYEELLMRWGVMTLLAWVGTKLVQQEQRRRAALPSAIVVTALLFGAGHLPATAVIVPLTPPIIARALLLNGIFGIAAGWLYWRRSLEAAMISHATGHIVFTVVSVADRRQ